MDDIPLDIRRKMVTEQAIFMMDGRGAMGSGVHRFFECNMKYMDIPEVKEAIRRRKIRASGPRGGDLVQAMQLKNVEQMLDDYTDEIRSFIKG